MSGKRITRQQEQLYMSSRKEGLVQKASAAKAGISERSGRAIEQGKRQRTPKRHTWRTRKDPFETVWATELVLMLEKEPSLQPLTLLEYLQNRYQKEYPDKLLRTLQRRVKLWRATDGPAKEVIFRQTHEPGRLGLSDFTTLKGVKIMVAEKEFSHLLYHFRLAYSGWSHMKVIQGGESFSALTEGLQEAFWRLGGTPSEHRTDSLSAAFKNLTKDEKSDMTVRYQAFCQHYKMKATRNNLGVSHENGSIESPHGHIKRRIEQALLLRGSNNFESIKSYETFIADVVNQHNRRNAKSISIERPKLQTLPVRKTSDYTEICARVNSSSSITVRRVTYTVPSNLQGEYLRIHLYHNRLDCYLGHQHVIQLNRIYSKGAARVRQIDYRHVIQSLVKKPQAFRYSQLRDDLLPSDGFRRIWVHADKTLDGKTACRFMVGALNLAAQCDCEQEMEKYLLKQINNNNALSLSQLQKRFKPKKKTFSDVVVTQHALSSYDLIMTNSLRQEVICG